ncbi:MAG: GDP-mannose 4,6-dehydratase [Candidatus Goldbacteria bacterium]|nr:GDP-mannose 4,6-dehydratase [Candidatus Goldiibacteriota bacterium]
MAQKKKALITGITGQDGSYLSEFLLEKDYKVYGIARRVSTPNLNRIMHIKDRIEIISADIQDMASVYKAIKQVRPDEIYNLAAMSFVPASWAAPYSTVDMGGLGVINVLESIRLIDKKIRFYQASSSEMFGKVRESPQNELTPFYPRSPYGIAKVTGHWLTVNYRESYDIFACSGICFNHESPRRGLEFASRKITYNVAKIKSGYAKELKMGNINSKRDWGFAGDYVRAMWMILQQKTPEDYVVSTEQTHEVREFLDIAFSHVGLDYKKYVKIDEKLYRPAEVDVLVGDSTKIRKKLGWKPEISFKQLVAMMVDADMELLKRCRPEEII